MGDARKRRRSLVLTLAFVCISLGDGLFAFQSQTRVDVGLTLLASTALLARRRFPALVFVLTLPGLAFGTTYAYVATLLALGSAAYFVDRRWVIFACGGATFGANMTWISLYGSFSPIVPTMLTGAVYMAAPIALGVLIKTRQTLTDQLVELERVRDRDQLARAELVLSTERARLAREMHDVVSHQVSLIAVQAGALMVSTSNPEVKEASRSIRTLAVRTLDELRQMVSVLRASGGDAQGIDPQPAIGDLSALVAGSGLDVTLTVHVASPLPATIERAVYRTVQEGLTNVLKHAPGSTVLVSVELDDKIVSIEVSNTGATEPLLDLPSARHGLVGLAERAELLSGHITTARTGHDGFKLSVMLPID
ncbi:hypothetical protein RU01_09775 [Rhodococcus sp. MEB064]|nr:hypothetical protein RU01_09775 [Rhodococcus sp. MEB064]